MRVPCSAFALTQIHCTFHAFGVEGLSRMRLVFPVGLAPPDSRVFSEGYVDVCMLLSVDALNLLFVTVTSGAAASDVTLSRSPWHTRSIWFRILINFGSRRLWYTVQCRLCLAIRLRPFLVAETLQD